MNIFISKYSNIFECPNIRYTTNFKRSTTTNMEVENPSWNNVVVVMDKTDNTAEQMKTDKGNEVVNILSLSSGQRKKSIHWHVIKKDGLV